MCSGSVAAFVFCTQPFFCTITCTLRVQRTLHCALSGVSPTLVFLNTTHDVMDAQKYSPFALRCHFSTCTSCNGDACWKETPGWAVQQARRCTLSPCTFRRFYHHPNTSAPAARVRAIVPTTKCPTFCNNAADATSGGGHLAKPGALQDCVASRHYSPAVA